MTIRNAATAHARLVEGLRPDNPVLTAARPGLDFSAAGALGQLNAEVTRQAAMVSYIDAFYALFLMSLAMVPLVLLMKPPAKTANVPIVHLD
jgi:DHA2 family multidrug resistance protein